MLLATHSRSSLNSVSTLKILKGINDYTPAVVLGANFSMKLNFSVDCTGAPVISWKQTTGGTNIQIAATMLGDSVYMAELAITNTNRSTYGTYRVSFCNTLLNVFTVFSLREGDCICVNTCMTMFSPIL